MSIFLWCHDWHIISAWVVYPKLTMGVFETHVSLYSKNEIAYKNVILFILSQNNGYGLTFTVILSCVIIHVGFREKPFA